MLEEEVNRTETLSRLFKKKKSKKNMKRLSFITQSKIEFLLPFTDCRKVLGKIPDHTDTLTVTYKYIQTKYQNPDMAWSWNLYQWRLMANDGSWLCGQWLAMWVFILQTQIWFLMMSTGMKVFATFNLACIGDSLVKISTSYHIYFVLHWEMFFTHNFWKVNSGWLLWGIYLCPEYCRSHTTYTSNTFVLCFWGVDKFWCFLTPFVWAVC